ncbi:Uu.00g058250.m01.CDS01 [Anthostomella pinea]|uniref:Uu.00g058250.m01.CDS01 n=1 Tax=Anthostomella pinea TaxID=933095 RepID=A0AAI8VL98_9PEZI|nr:Uu.00g058250.m01.CDS01 [Anthostomella pinea]
MLAYNSVLKVALLALAATQATAQGDYWKMQSQSGNQAASAPVESTEEKKCTSLNKEFAINVSKTFTKDRWLIPPSLLITLEGFRVEFYQEEAECKLRKNVFETVGQQGLQQSVFWPYRLEEHETKNKIIKIKAEWYRVDKV